MQDKIVQPIPNRGIPQFSPSKPGLDSLLANLDVPYAKGLGMLTLNGEHLGRLANTEARILKDMGKHGEVIYKIVVNGEVLAAFNAEVLKKDKGGNYKNSFYQDSRGSWTSYGIGEETIKDADFLKLTNIYLSKNIPGQDLIQTMVEASINEGCGGKVKVCTGGQAVFYAYGFRSDHYKDNKKIDQRLSVELQCYEVGKGIDTKDLGGGTMFLPETAISTWKTEISKNPILNLKTNDETERPVKQGSITIPTPVSVAVSLQKENEPAKKSVFKDFMSSRFKFDGFVTHLTPDEKKKFDQLASTLDSNGELIQNLRILDSITNLNGVDEQNKQLISIIKLISDNAPTDCKGVSQKLIAAFIKDNRELNVFLLKPDVLKSHGII